MSLRTRLIIAFLLLSVVPLTAVTLLSYTSSVRAFESAAEQEASASAADIGQRMETITNELGRRMDRLFVANGGASGEAPPDPTRVRERVAPLLGETAALVDRVEFRPVTPAPPAATAGGGVRVGRSRRPPAGRRPPRTAPAPPVPGVAPAPPAPPSVIVMDIPKIVEEATRAAAAGIGPIAGEELSARIQQDVQKQLAASRERMTEIAAQAKMAADAATSAHAQAEANRAVKRLQMDVEGRQVEIAIHREGRLLGHANATLNMNRTMQTVLALARREQGEIPFAIDRRGGVYTPEPDDKARLDLMGINAAALTAVPESGRRVGDWIVVARRAPSGITFGIARPIGESLREIRRASVRNLSLGLLVVGVAFIGIIPISRRMTRHLSTLTDGVHQLSSGDFSTRVPVRSSDEFGTLATAFNQMAADLERHQELVVEQERLRRELELSRLIQTEMLPRAPLVSGPAEIAGVSIPAREVGGDFFNYFVLPDGRLALLVGDVSGKGVSAALLMANVQATLRARLPHESDLALLADALDRELDQNTPGPVYLTLFLGILDMDARLLRYVNAGHNPQFLLRTDGTIQPMSSTGLPIALYAGHGYRESRVALAAGDLLFFYTDGLVETENEAGDMFGAERLQALLAEEHSQSVDTVLHRVEHAITTFRGRAEPFDDATLMALRISD
jgi:serine phosphatase RsbU (regulator of sigma subunit)